MTMPERSRPRTTGGVRSRKLSSASLYSSGLSDEAATRINTSSAAGCGTGTRTASSGSPARSLVKPTPRNVSGIVCVCFMFHFLQIGAKPPSTKISLPAAKPLSSGRGRRRLPRCPRRARYPPLGRPFVSAILRRLYERSRPFRGGFRGGPVAGPFTITQDFVAAMNGKFDEHRPLGDAQHFATDVDDAPTQFET